jgi:hypothetical protein
MNELVQFLRDRLDEDEALAREAPPGPWHVGNAVDPTQPCHVHTFPGARLVADGLNWLVAEHIARQHPARVLAEVKAKRRRLDQLDSANRAGHDSYDLASVLLPLEALPYADHPDYRAEWRAGEDTT